MKAIVIDQLGGPDVLNVRESPIPDPGPGEVRLAVEAAGVNFIDTYQRTGLYPMQLPFTPGLEGAGTVETVGENVTAFAPGDRVAWATSIGSYAEYTVAPQEALVRIPDGVQSDLAAAVLLQGMTAHYLAHDTFPLSEGDRCLIHAGAGGVGLLLTQVAKMAGAEVFTTAGGAEKVELSQAAGADHAIDYRAEDFGDAVERIAGQQALDVVYDGVGASVFDRSLALLRPRGMMVTYGNASGPVDPVSPLRLSQGGSLFLTRPTLFHYISERSELEKRAADLFGWIADGRLDVRVGLRLPLTEAQEAHRRLEARDTTGKVLLIP